jgi:hypothetical protein
MAITLDNRKVFDGKRGYISFPVTTLTATPNTDQVTGFNILIKQLIITNTSASPVVVTVADASGNVFFNESIAARPNNATQFITFERDGLYLVGGFKAWAATGSVCTITGLISDAKIASGVAI